MVRSLEMKIDFIDRFIEQITRRTVFVVAGKRIDLFYLFD